jgi:hypothetical protein
VRPLRADYIEELLVLAVLPPLATAMLSQVASLGVSTSDPAALLFWLPYLALVSVSAWAVIRKEGRFAMVVIIALSFVLNFISRVRQPAGFSWDVDEPHHLQISSKIIETGHLYVAYPGFTGEAMAYSLYPGLDLLVTFLNELTSIPAWLLYRYSFCFLNITVLFFLYYLLRRLDLDSRTSNLCIFLYALCPTLHGFTNAGVSESLGIIFYTFLLSVFLLGREKSGRTFAVIFLIMASSLVVSHHFTMHLLIFEATILMIGTYLLCRSLSVGFFRLLILVVGTGAWLALVALLYLSTNIDLIVRVIQVLQLSYQGVQPIPPPWSMPPVEKALSYAGIGALVLTGFAGAWSWLHRTANAPCEKRTPLLLLGGLSLFLLVIFEATGWRMPQLIEVSEIRFRAVGFAYFGIVIFSGIGIVSFLGRQLKYTKILAVLLALLLISIPTVTVAYPFYYYHNSPVRACDYFGYPEESYDSSMWLKEHGAMGWIAGTWGEYTYISGHAGMNLSYLMLVRSFKEHEVLTKFYSLNRACMSVPDAFGYELARDDVMWLQRTADRVYANGGMMDYWAI